MIIIALIQIVLKAFHIIKIDSVVVIQDVELGFCEKQNISKYFGLLGVGLNLLSFLLAVL